MTMNKKEKIGLVVLTIILCGLSWLWGLSLGINIPSQFDITVDTGDNYKEVVGRLENISYNTRPIINQTCIINERFYDYAISNFKESNKAKSEIKTFCKLPYKSGKLYLDQPRESYFIELNRPVTFEGYELEIVGGSDTDRSVVFSINGNRYYLFEGDRVSNKNMTVVVLQTFLTTIPYLDASAAIEVIYHDNN